MVERDCFLAMQKLVSKIRCQLNDVVSDLCPSHGDEQ